MQHTQSCVENDILNRIQILGTMAFTYCSHVAQQKGTVGITQNRKVLHSHRSVLPKANDSNQKISKSNFQNTIITLKKYRLNKPSHRSSEAYCTSKSITSLQFFGKVEHRTMKKGCMSNDEQEKTECLNRKMSYHDRKVPQLGQRNLFFLLVFHRQHQKSSGYKNMKQF